MGGEFRFCLVLRGREHVPAEVSLVKGNLRATAVDYLKKFPNGNSTCTIPHGEYQLVFLMHDAFSYVVLSDQDVPKAVAMGFMEKLRTDFVANYGKVAMTMGPDSLTKKYGPQLKKELQYASKHHEEFSKFAKLQSQITEVKGIMQQNIKKALDRGEKMEKLNVQADSLAQAADKFKSTSVQIKDKLWWQNMKVKAIVLGGLLVLGIVLFFSICGGLHCVGL